LVFGLPGNPVSCFATFRLIVVPALERMRGRLHGTPVYPRVDVEITRPIEMDPIRPEYHRAVARWEGGHILATSTGFQRSSRVTSVNAANCFLEIPKDKGVLPEGSIVKALLFGSGLSAGTQGYPHLNATMRPSPIQGSWPHRVGLLFIGPEGLSSEKEASDCLLEAVSCELVRRYVDSSPQNVSDALVAMSGDDEPNDETCDIIFLLGSFGLSVDDAAVVSAVKALLHRDAPGLGTVILQAGLSSCLFTMLEQLITGVRHKCILLTLPSSGVSTCLKAVWPFLSHASPKPNA